MMFRNLTAVYFLMWSLHLACGGPDGSVCHADEPAAEPPAGISTDRRLTALIEEIARREPDLAKRVMAYVVNELEGLRQESERLRKELESERQTRLERIRVLAAEAERLKRKLEEQERRQAALLAAEEKAKQELDASAQRSRATAQQMRDLMKEVEDLRNRLRDRLAQVEAKFQVGERPRPVAAGPAPDVEGVVTAVSDLGYVEISIGSDKGLVEGHLLDVFNAAGSEAQRVARVRIVRAISDRAVGKVLPDVEKIKAGHRVKAGAEEDKAEQRGDE